MISVHDCGVSGKTGRAGSRLDCSTRLAVGSTTGRKGSALASVDRGAPSGRAAQRDAGDGRDAGGSTTGRKGSARRWQSGRGAQRDAGGRVGRAEGLSERIGLASVERSSGWTRSSGRADRAGGRSDEPGWPRSGPARPIVPSKLVRAMLVSLATKFSLQGLRDGKGGRP
jgi:hypothetical protein